MNTIPLVLRPTSVIQYERCPESYRLSTVLKIRTIETSHATALGKAGHRATLPYVAAHAQGSEIDPLPLFRAAWEEVLDNNVVRFSSKDAKQLTKVGEKLVTAFPAAWKKSGLKAIVVGGKPLVENRLRLKIGDDIELSGEPDIVAERVGSDEPSIVNMDEKFAASVAQEGFAKLSDQLTAYNLLLDMKLSSMGLAGQKVTELGFMEGIKNIDAYWAAPQIVPARTIKQMGSYVEKLKMVGALMRKGYFPKRSGAAYESPCNMCEFANLCQNAVSEGLTSPYGDVDDLANSDYLPGITSPVPKRTYSQAA